MSMNIFFCGRLSNGKIYPKFEKLKFNSQKDISLEQIGIQNIFHAFNCMHFIGNYYLELSFTFFHLIKLENNKIYNWNVQLDLDHTNLYSSMDKSQNLPLSSYSLVYTISVEENSYLNDIVNVIKTRSQIIQQDRIHGQIIDAQSTKSDVIFSTSNLMLQFPIYNYFILKKDDCLFDYQLKTGENLIACTLRSLPKQISGVISFFKIVQIACGNEHVLILSNFGQVYSYGNAQNGRLGYKVQSESTPKSNKIKENEDIQQEEVYQPQLIESIKGLNVKQISCGQSHNIALAVSRDQEYSLYPKNIVIVWGCNVQGSLGIGTNQDVDEPLINTFYDNLNPIKVECGINYSLVLNDNGELTAFGGNEYGQLGLGHDTPCYVPQKINFEFNDPIKNIYSSQFHCYAVSCNPLQFNPQNIQILNRILSFKITCNIFKIENGNLYGWGNCWDGQLGIGEIVQVQKEPKQIDQSILSTQLIKNNLENMKMILTLDQSYFIIGKNLNRNSETSTISETSENIDQMSPSKPNIIAISPSRRTVTIQSLTNQSTPNDTVLQNKSALFLSKEADISISKIKSKSFFEESSKNATKPTESPFLRQFNGYQSFIDPNQPNIKRSPSKPKTIAETSQIKHYLKKQSSIQDQQEYQLFLQQQQQRNQAQDSSKSPNKFNLRNEEYIQQGSQLNQVSFINKVANPVTAKSIQELLKKKTESLQSNQLYTTKLFKSFNEDQLNVSKVDTKRKRIFALAPTTQNTQTNVASITMIQQTQQSNQQYSNQKTNCLFTIKIYNRHLDQNKKSKSEVTLNQRFDKSPIKNTEESQQFANRLQVSKHSEKVIHPSQIQNSSSLFTSQSQSLSTSQTNAIRLTLNKEVIPKIEKPLESKSETFSQSDIKDYDEGEGKIEQEKVLDQSTQDKIIEELQKHIQAIYIDVSNDQSKVDDIIKKWQHHLKKKANNSKSLSNSELIELFQFGIPAKIRAEVWRIFLPNRLSITKSFYKLSKVRAESFLRSKQLREKDKQTRQKRIQSNSSYINQFEDVDITDLSECKFESINTVEVDIERTFTYLILKLTTFILSTENLSLIQNLDGFGKTGTLGKIMRNVLVAFVASRPDIGYLQGMSYIVSIFAIFFNEFDTFISFSNFITLPSILPFYFLDEKSLTQKYQIFKNILHSNLPNLCDHFETEGVHPRMYMLQLLINKKQLYLGLITIYSNTLNLACVCLIWDHILLDGGGLIYFYKAGVAMLSLIENQLMRSDFEGIMMDLGKLNELINDPVVLSKKMRKIQIEDWIEQEIKNISKEFQDY